VLLPQEKISSAKENPAKERRKFLIEIWVWVIIFQSYPLTKELSLEKSQLIRFLP
jgi:hypothetical protein